DVRAGAPGASAGDALEAGDRQRHRRSRPRAARAAVAGRTGSAVQLDVGTRRTQRLETAGFRLAAAPARPPPPAADRDVCRDGAAGAWPAAGEAVTYRQRRPRRGTARLPARRRPSEPGLLHRGTRRTV